MPRDSLGDRISFVAKQTSFMEHRLFMHAQKERPRLHTFLPQFRSELVSIHGGAVLQNDTIHPVDVPCPWLLDGQLKFADILELPCVFTSHPALLLDDLCDPFKLCQAKGGLHVRKPEVESQFLVIEPAAGLEREVTQGPCFLCESVTVGKHHAPFACRDQFVCVEAE